VTITQSRFHNHFGEIKNDSAIAEIHRRKDDLINGQKTAQTINVSKNVRTGFIAGKLRESALLQKPKVWASYF